MTEEYQAKKRILLYSEPKSGKTTAIGTVPKGSKVYVVDVDRQAGSLVQEWKKRGHARGNLKIVPVDTTIDTSTEDGADQMFDLLRTTLWKPPPGYDFYVIDSYTAVGILLTHAICGVADREYNQRNNTDLSSYVNDLFWQFAGTAERYGAWLIVVMHEKWREIKDPLNPNPKNWRDKKELLAPEVASSARVTIPSQCPFVWHVERSRGLVSGVSTSISMFRTRGTPQVMASTTGYDGILNDMEPADIGAVLKKLKLNHKAQKSKGKP